MNNLLFIVTISTYVNGDGFIHHRLTTCGLSCTLQGVGVGFILLSNLTNAVTRKGQIRKEITEATVRQTLLLCGLATMQCEVSCRGVA